MSSSAAQWILLAAPVVAGAITAAYGLMFALSGRDRATIGTVTLRTSLRRSQARRGKERLMNRFLTVLLCMLAVVACASPIWAQMAEGPTGTLKITVVPAEVHATVTVVAAPDSVWRRTQRQPDGIYLLDNTTSLWNLAGT